ncbi:unnamed protein product [Cunninghamella blakesleeana]
MATTNDQFYLPFGKELAANEKKNRDKAVRALKRYLGAAGDSLTPTHLQKLWKGLFYCFWMSDKPLVQQALANELGSLILEIPDNNTIPFIKAFWEVHCAEWHGLDRIRLDKYYLLFRRFVYFSFAWLAKNNWDEEKIEEYTTCLLEGPLHPTDRTKPDAISFHIMEIYFEELEKILEQQEQEEEDLDVPMEAIIRPLNVLSTDAINKVTRKKAKEILKEYEDEMENVPDAIPIDEDMDSNNDDSEMED